MHQLHNFLANLTLVLGVAAVTAFLFQRLRQPVVLGYILAGMIVGPYIPIPLAVDSDIVHTLSELGIIFLLFSLGLEFSIRKLMKVLPTAGLITLIQCAFMLWLGYITGRAFGWSNIESFYAGAMIAISSTTIVVKAFSELGIRDNVTETVFAILIVEDFIAILLLAGLPALTQSRDSSGLMFAKAVGTLVMFLVTVIAAGMILIPRILRIVMRMNRSEVTLVVIIGICFAISLLAKEMGYSVALGAFIAGSLMAESGDEGYLDTLIRPVRDLFAAVFFVSVGMLFDPSVFARHWLSLLIFIVLVVVGKFLGVTVGTFLVGYGTRHSIRTGLSLAQIGEFSFIIAGMGVATGATGTFLFPLAVAVSIITTFAAPWRIRGSDTIAKWVDKYMPHRLQTFTTLYSTWIQRLRQPQSPVARSRIKRLSFLLFIDTVLFTSIILGALLSLETLTSRLKTWIDLPEIPAQSIGILMTIVLATPFGVGIIRCIHALGFELTARVMPRQEKGKLDLAVAPRRVLTVTLQLGIVLLVGLPLLALTQPFVPSFYSALVFAIILMFLGVVFWRGTTQLYGHVRAGAEMVVEMLSTSMEKQREISVIPEDQFLPGLGSVFSIRLVPGSLAIGRTLADLNLRGITGASVIAITHGKQGVVVPTGKERLQEGDILAITGTEEALKLSKQLLLGRE